MGGFNGEQCWFMPIGCDGGGLYCEGKCKICREQSQDYNACFFDMGVDWLGCEGRIYPPELVCDDNVEVDYYDCLDGFNWWSCGCGGQYRGHDESSCGIEAACEM
jgi:hypothetical protein